MAKLTLLLPTCNPDSMERHFMRTVKSIVPASYMFELNILFQPPYTEKQIEDVCSRLRAMGITVNADYRKYGFDGGAIPFNTIRNDCVMESDSDYYALVDDDFEFLPLCDRFLLDMTTFLDEFKEVGVLQCENHCDALQFTLVDKPLAFNWFTYHGFFVRNMREKGYKVFPEDSLNVLGAGEEYVLALSRIAEGYRGVRVNASGIRHETKILRDDIGSKYGWELPEITEAANGIKSYVIGLKKRIEEGKK